MEYSRSLDSMVEEIDTILGVSREAFKAAGDRGLRKNKEASLKRMVLAKIEVKPSHDEVDLVTLTERITSNTWTLADKTFSPKWQQAKPLDPLESSTQLLYGKIVPIGYGICKIILDCVIDSEELDGLCDSIIELLGEDNEDCVQSVDVDWKNVFPIGDAKDILQIKG
jgi:translation elongation factor EF-1beta